MLEITLVDEDKNLIALGDDQKQALVSLRGIIDFNFVKATIKLKMKTIKEAPAQEK